MYESAINFPLHQLLHGLNNLGFPRPALLAVQAITGLRQAIASVPIRPSEKRFRFAADVFQTAFYRHGSNPCLILRSAGTTR